MQPIVRKSEFAAYRGVSASRLSHWLKEGRIRPEALRGSGHSAKIHVETADKELASWPSRQALDAAFRRAARFFDPDSGDP